MVRVACAAALACLALPGVLGENISIKVDVFGSSGKFEVYDESKGKGTGVVVEMDALREVDANGDTVGNTGSTKHSIQTFANQTFEIHDAESVTINGTNASKITFESSIPEVGKIKVETYVFTEDGYVGTDTESWSVKPGDLKWNIELFEWFFLQSLRKWRQRGDGGVHRIGLDREDALRIEPDKYLRHDPGFGRWDGDGALQPG